MLVFVFVRAWAEHATVLQLLAGAENEKVASVSEY